MHSVDGAEPQGCSARVRSLVRSQPGYPAYAASFVFRNLYSSCVVFNMLRRLLHPRNSPKRHIVHLQSLSWHAICHDMPEQAGLSWVEAALPIQVSLNGGGTPFLPQGSGKPTQCLLRCNFPLQMAGNHKSILSPYIADFCQHGPLIECICLFSPCLSKRGRTGSTSHHSPCLLRSGSLLAHRVSSVLVCSGSPGLLFITWNSLSLEHRGTKLCMKTL